MKLQRHKKTTARDAYFLVGDVMTSTTSTSDSSSRGASLAAWRAAWQAAAAAVPTPTILQPLSAPWRGTAATDATTTVGAAVHATLAAWRAEAAARDPAAAIKKTRYVASQQHLK